MRECIADKPNPLPGKVVIDMGLVPHLLKLLSEEFNKEEVLQIEVSWLLANVCGGSTQDTMCLVKEGIIPVIIKNMKSTTNKILHENVIKRTKPQ